MNIFDYYIEKNKNKLWTDLYTSTSSKNRGKTFAYINTNFRSLYAFEDIFKKFYSYNNLDRSEWKLNPNHGQEEAKQWVVNMVQSKLFKKEKSHYTLTEKGKAFKDLLESNLEKQFRWPVLYLFFSNAYFSYKPNYIYKISNDLLTTLENAGYTYDWLMHSIENLVKQHSSYTTDLFSQEIFWVISFYRDEDFLYLLKNSKNEEKKRLYDLCVNNYHNENFNDCISYKYKPGGQYTKNTFVDDLKTLYITFYLIRNRPLSFKEYINSVLSGYENLYEVKKTETLDFVYAHTEIFEVIYEEIFQSIEEDIVNNYEYTPLQKAKKVSEEKIDDTTAKNKDKIRKVSSVLKRMAKERANYKCELQDLNNCKYFTSKESNKNYLEIHHIVPREFSNEFEKSIEIIDNYISLCPHCHRLVHFGIDRERLPSLIYLFNKRKEALNRKSINVDLENLKIFYNIEERI